MTLFFVKKFGVSMYVDADFSVLIYFLWPGTSSRSFFKGIEMWKEETILKVEFAEFLLSRCIIRGISFAVLKSCSLFSQKEMVNRQETFVNSRGERKTNTDSQFNPPISLENHIFLMPVAF